MKIKDYIQEYRLILLARDPAPGEARWLPPELLDDEERKLGTRPHFDIYANADRNHFVSLNQTRHEFRILRREIVDVLSEWHSSSGDYASHSSALQKKAERVRRLHQRGNRLLP